MANKWLIANNRFLWSASVNYHYELLPNNVTRDKAAGGGWWYLDRNSKKFILFSKSDDFGYASKEDILSALDRTLFSTWMDGVGFYITRFDNLADAIVEINDKQIQPDWVYDDSSELIVDDMLPVTSPSNKEGIIYFSGDTHHNYTPKATPIVKIKKIGRNDPCGCRSGKKNKKCCNTQ